MESKPKEKKKGASANAGGRPEAGFAGFSESAKALLWKKKGGK